MAATGQIFVEFVDWGFLHKFETIHCFLNWTKITYRKTYIHLWYLTIYTLKKCGSPREAGEIVNLNVLL